MKKPRAVRVWLVVLSLVAVTIVAGCGGAGAAAVRALGRAVPRATPRSAPVFKPAAYTPPRFPVVSPSPPAPGSSFRVGTKVDHGVGGGRDGATIHAQFPVNDFPTVADRDDARKK